MNSERIFQIIQAPHVTEKSSLDSQVVVLKVSKDAKKPEIKIAVEQLMDVKVEAVRVLNVKGKVKMSRFGKGRRSDWRKAYVRLSAPVEVDGLVPGSNS